MKAQFLKIAGVKSEAAFYKKYPTEQAFFKAHPEAQMMKAGGTFSGNTYYQDGGWHSEWEDDETNPYNQQNIAATVQNDIQKRKPTKYNTALNKVNTYTGKIEDALLNGYFNNPINLASGFVSKIAANKKAKEQEQWIQEQMMTDNLFPVTNTSRGDWAIAGSSYGQFRPDQIGAKSPYGMALGGQNSALGLDMGKRVYDGVAEDPYQVSKTMQPVPREMANIEAEKGETAYGDIDGDGEMEHMHISGKRHVNGGTPLNVPEGTFIYSDTKKMQIGGKTLERFGKSGSGKNKYTPAELAKQYDVNKYKAIIDDPKSDKIQKRTAQMMMGNYERKLAELALVQESMKGFPQGIPDVAKSLVQQMQGGAEQEQPQMAYGGMALPTYQSKGEVKKTVKYGKYADDYKALETLLKNPANKALRDELYSRYKTIYPNTPATQDEYINDLLGAQEQVYAINNKYADDPSKLTDRTWDSGGRNKRYNQEAQSLGYKPLNDTQIKRFQQGYRILADLMEDDRFKQNFGDVFQVNPRGVADQTYKGKAISGDDDWMGNTSIGQYFTLRPKKEEARPVTTKTTIAPMPNIGQEYKAPQQGFFAPDKAKMANSLQDRLSNQKFMPWEPPIELPRMGFVGYSPERELANNNEMAAMQFNANAMFGDPQNMAARNSAVSGNAAQNAANILGKYNNLNVGQAQRVNEVNLQQGTNEAAMEFERAKRLYDNTVKTNQNYLNFDRAARNKQVGDYASAFDNMMTYNIADAINPQYAVDRNTAQIFQKYTKNPFTPNRGILGSGTSTGSSPFDLTSVYQQQQEQVAQLKQFFPGLTDQQALERLDKLTGGNKTRTTTIDRNNDQIPESTSTTQYGNPKVSPFQ